MARCALCPTHASSGAGRDGIPPDLMPLAQAVIHTLTSAILHCLAAADEDVDGQLVELQQLAGRILSADERRVLAAAIQQLERALDPCGG